MAKALPNALVSVAPFAHESNASNGPAAPITTQKAMIRTGLAVNEALGRIGTQRAIYRKTEPRMMASVLTGVASETSSAVLFMLRMARLAS